MLTQLALLSQLALPVLLALLAWRVLPAGLVFVA